MRRKVRRFVRDRLARLWRLFLGHVTIVAVTGSCGKSTTVALLGALLATKGPGEVGLYFNSKGAIGQTVRRTRLWHHWCVQEVSVCWPGHIPRQMSILRPHIGIVTLVGTDHLSHFRTSDAIAEEKSALVAALPESGLAILNADDPRVLAMRQKTKARVVTFGRSVEADLRASDVLGAWPERLSFSVHWKDQSPRVECRFVGEYWITSILAALACALELGISLDEAVRIVSDFQPLPTRNSVQEIAGGPTFLLDTIKAPFGTIEAAVDTLKSASAPRKTLVLGNISDYSGASSPKYRSVARLAAKVGIRVVGVGPNAGTIRKMAHEFPHGQVAVFPGSREARDYLRADAIPGELILLKSAPSGHIERIFLNWEGEGDLCWVEGCGLKYCRSCRHRTDASLRPKPRLPAVAQA